MIWVDREAKKLIDRKLKLEWIDDMKTPSGRIHVGSLRGVIVHDLIFKALKDFGITARFSYVFNDMDQMDALPSYLNKKKYEPYMGMPLNRIPPPEPGFKNFAQYYAREFIEVFNSLNCHPEIIWSSELYESGKMNDVIRTVLDQTDKVKEIYKKVAKAERPKKWFPYNPVCEQCGKIGTTVVYDWDGTYVSYRCEPDVVSWTHGCDFSGKTEPINAHGKLPWKLDWPAHWKIIGVTIEGSGKDHMSSGGSYDMASAICKEILHTEPPYAIPYEWFTIGGRKMSSSKGIGTSAKEVSRILPPDVFRFLLVRTNIGTHLDFNPFGDTIPNLFDDYDKCLDAYFIRKKREIPEGKQGEVVSDFARIIELSTVNTLPEKRVFMPRFRTLVNILRNNQNPKEVFERQKGTELNSYELAVLKERTAYAHIYIEQYAENGHDKPETSDSSLSTAQTDFIIWLTTRIQEKTVPEDIPELIGIYVKEGHVPAKQAFQSLYLSLTGKPYGPKLVDLLQSLGIDETRKRLDASLRHPKIKPADSLKNHLYPDLTDGRIFSVDPKVKTIYPSIVVGVAIIKNVHITQTPDTLKKKIDAFVNSQSDLTNELIGSYPEIKTYRKLYKQMGIDWHSRRPSPEALLRRIALKKPLYTVNSCVDAYNLVVMKHRVSTGAFDLDKIKLPTVLRFPNPGEQILLLGEQKPTTYEEKELAYFDQNGGYNIDFNYRDSQQTAVTEQTKNLFINIDGIFDISRAMVEETLRDTINEITKYCGGVVETAGIVT